MSEISDITQHTVPDRTSLLPINAECHMAESAHIANVRFHLILDLALAAIATLILKLDGPYYADAIVAGLFACGFGVTVHSWLSVRGTEATVHSVQARRREEEERLGMSPATLKDTPKQTLVFVLLATFFLSAAVATIWFSYASLRDANAAEDDAVARTMTARPAAC